MVALYLAPCACIKTNTMTSCLLNKFCLRCCYGNTICKHFWNMNALNPHLLHSSLHTYKWYFHDSVLGQVGWVNEGKRVNTFWCHSRIRIQRLGKSSNVVLTWTRQFVVKCMNSTNKSVSKANALQKIQFQ